MSENSGLCARESDRLFDPVAGEKSIGLAVSGGTDSLALMILVRDWLQGSGAGIRGPKVFVYSVDHGLRPEAGAECEKVRDIALDFGFEHRILVWRGKKPGTGLQVSARRARYGLIGRQMEVDGARILLSGHHMDDQAETVLMRLARGSGLNGLRGMESFSEVEGVRVFRPLLALGRQDLVKIVEQAGLEPCHDPSNEDLGFERVRWRKFLARNGEKGLDGANLARFAARMGRAQRALEVFCHQRYEELVEWNQFGVQMICRERFLEQPCEIAIRLLGEMIYRASGGRSHGELSQLETLLQHVRKDGFSGEVTGGCVIALHGGKVAVFREVSRIRDTRYVLAPGESIVWDGRFVVENRRDRVVIVKGAEGLERRQLKKISGDLGHVRMGWIHCCPLVVDENEKLLAIGEQSFDELVFSRLVNFQAKVMI